MATTESASGEAEASGCSWEASIRAAGPQHPPPPDPSTVQYCAVLGGAVALVELRLSPSGRMLQVHGHTVVLDRSLG
jgi:hypothetical protein